MLIYNKDYTENSFYPPNFIFNNINHIKNNFIRETKNTNYQLVLSFIFLSLDLFKLLIKLRE